MKPIFISFASLLLLLLTTAPAQAKNCTIGIYGVIHRVEFEPGGAQPLAVRITGQFVVPVPTSTCGYQAPQEGYLYFRIRPGAERATIEDWNRLKAAAGTGRIVGFADYWEANPDDPQGNPHTSLVVTVHSVNQSAPPATYPTPNRKGVVERADQTDPRFAKIAMELKLASAY
jgi:hypothetical protein